MSIYTVAWIFLSSLQLGCSQSDTESAVVESSIKANESRYTMAYYSTTWITIGFLSMLTTLLVGVFGNVLVIIVIIRSKVLHTPTNCYLLSLSLSDLLSLVLNNMPILLESFSPIDYWRYGMVGCKIWAAMQYFNTEVSALSITAFSIERWVAVCHPLKSHTLCTVDRALKIIVCIWIFCGLYSIVWLKYARIYVYNTARGIVYKCAYATNRHHNVLAILYIIDLLMFYVFPLMVTFALYMQIAHRLYRRPEHLNASLQSPMCQQRVCCREARSNGRRWHHFVMCKLRRNNDNEESVVSNHTPNFSCQRIKERQLKARREIVKMLMLVVLLFAVLWMPYRAWMVYNSFASHPYYDYWHRLFARTMCYISSAVNPFLYNAMSRRFRRAFKQFLCTSFRPKSH